MTWQKNKDNYRTHRTISMLNATHNVAAGEDVEMPSSEPNIDAYLSMPVPSTSPKSRPADEAMFLHPLQLAKSKKKQHSTRAAGPPSRYDVIFTAEDCSMCKHRPGCHHFLQQRTVPPGCGETQNILGNHDLLDVYLASLNPPSWKGFDWIISKTGFESVAISASRGHYAVNTESRRALCLAICYNCEASRIFSVYVSTLSCRTRS
ncbi:hypothetical protein SISNIDRAFT_174622 [Sistotremastrum niveocremeum HHB9708]|uniref:Uncharacterized protein n=1 Tax=Sistotremastrum niveocremeum HHB9708 TaxID=1314777 RepID=A0A164RMW6_9AGAM|nr:hypothetical protein SISNIDRAFT_174622 [Sistotremastrum niveocremeum HHB9708]